jgi:hypothetical protein
MRALETTVTASINKRNDIGPEYGGSDERHAARIRKEQGFLAAVRNAIKVKEEALKAERDRASKEGLSKLPSLPASVSWAKPKTAEVASSPAQDSWHGGEAVWNFAVFTPTPSTPAASRNPWKWDEEYFQPALPQLEQV